MKWRVSFTVPQGTPSGAVRNAVNGVEYEATTYLVGPVGELTLFNAGPSSASARRLVICFAPGTWRTISPVGAADTADAISENSERRQEA